jgi:CubicO group peptidase (beta-lactamase class C family)
MTDSRPLRLAVTAFCLAVAPAVARGQDATVAPAPDAADLEARVARLVEQLEADRVEMHVPGMAIAVVKDDEVVLSRGFGHADLEAERPATSETLFAIGSSSKAFTAALVGMLVDEGVVGWDDPVATHLPGFELKVETGGEPITIRDLLCHRTGFTRMSVLWAGGAISRDEIVAAAGTAEPWAGFRERFLYNNVMYLAAGMAAARAADTTWDDLVAARLLGPLGMDDSSTRVSEAEQDPRLAKGYFWEDDPGAFTHLPMRHLDAIAPAGAVNSNADDMARWLRLQLGRGEIDGQRLIEEATLAETWSPQMEVGGGVHYGFGWMVREWKGRRLLEHGGNIDGFAAQVALLPDDGLGFALLTNVSMTGLQQGSIGRVFEALLGDVPADGDAAVAADLDLDDYVGTYIANIGQAFRDAEFEVLVRDGVLAVDVPGRMVYPLHPPNDEGKWVFTVTDQIAVSFTRDDDDGVRSMTMYQGGYEFELPREGVELPVDVPLDELQRYLGRYRAEAPADMTVTVLIHNNRLSVDVPGQMVYELAPPDDEGTWPVRVRPAELQVRFDEGDDGAVTSLTFLQAGTETLMTRLADEAESEIPTVEALLARVRAGYGADRLPSLGTIRMSGTLRFVHQGATGTFTSLADGTTHFRADLDLGRLGWIASALGPDGAWSDSSFHPFQALTGDQLEHARRDHPLRPLGDWTAQFDSIAVLRADEVDGERAFVVRLEHGDLPTRTVWVGAESGLVLREESVEYGMGGMITVPITYRYADYREVEGIRLAHRTWTENEFSGRMLLEVETVQTGVEAGPEAFSPPPGATGGP